MDAMIELIAGSPGGLASAGAYFVQEGWATAQLVAAVLAQSVPTEVPLGRSFTVGERRSLGGDNAR